MKNASYKTFSIVKINYLEIVRRSTTNMLQKGMFHSLSVLHKGSSAYYFIMAETSFSLHGRNFNSVLKSDFHEIEDFCKTKLFHGLVRKKCYHLFVWCFKIKRNRF